jgi:hypothetical protein
VISNIDRSLLGVVQLPPSLESLSIICGRQKWASLLPPPSSLPKLKEIIITACFRYDDFRRSTTLTDVMDGDGWYPLIVWLNQWLNAVPTLKYIQLYSNIQVWAHMKRILVKVAHQDRDEWMTYDMEGDA